MKSEGKTGYGEKHRLADNPGTLPGVLARLACDDNWHVRLNVAHNPSTPGALLTRLSEDKSFLDVRSSVARNPNTPGETLDKLSRDTQSSVLRSLAHNPSTPVGILARLTRHNSQGVRIDAKREFTQRQNRGKDNQ